MSRANLKVSPGERYRISVPTDQLWFDKTRQNVPPEGEPGSWTMNLVKALKRHDFPWFALMAATSTCVADVAKLCSRTRSDALESVPVLKNPTEITIQKSGELAFYPNDAIAPWGDHLYFYNNNRGQIWVIVERLASGQ